MSTYNYVPVLNCGSRSGHTEYCSSCNREMRAEVIELEKENARIRKKLEELEDYYYQVNGYSYREREE